MQLVELCIMKFPFEVRCEHGSYICKSIERFMSYDSIQHVTEKIIWLDRKIAAESLVVGFNIITQRNVMFIFLRIRNEKYI